MIKAYIENQKWDEDEQGFIHPPRPPSRKSIHAATDAVPNTFCAAPGILLAVCATTYRQMRRSREQHMDMIRRYRPADDYHLPHLAHLANQVARTLCDPTSQNLVTIFRDPDDMVFQVKSRVRLVPIFSHPPIFKDLS